MTTTFAAIGAETTRTGGLFAGLSQLIETYRQARARKRTLIALADLEDHVLRDIGFNPGEVRGSQRPMVDWVVQTQSGSARLLFIGH